VLFGRHTQRKAEVKGNLLAELRVWRLQLFNM
jgi:hypothetical protein